MKVVRCLNGHYYDGDKYATCPHCGANEAGAGNQTMDAVQEPVAPPAQTANTDQYYYTNGVIQAGQADFKTPNMNLNKDAAMDFPPTVSYGHGDFVRDAQTGQIQFQNSVPLSEMPTEDMDCTPRPEPQSEQFENPYAWQGAPSANNGQYAENVPNEAQQRFVAEAAPTATLNVPVKPSLKQNVFKQVPPNGFSAAEDYGVVNIASGMPGETYDETMVLSSGGLQQEPKAEQAFLTQVSTHQRFFITDSQTIIGKVNSKIQNDISVSNSTVSRRHACIYHIENRYFIEDLESTNKTHLNGIDIGSGRLIELKDNDNLVLSDEEFIFSLI